MKQCSKCGDAKPFSEFSPQKSCKDGYRGTCKKCASLFAMEWAERKKDSLVGRMMKFLIVTRNRSKRENIPFDLDLQFLVDLYTKQNGKCAISGLSFNNDSVLYIRTSPYTPSLDRIDSHKGYTKDNVHFVLYSVNVAKNEWNFDVIIPIWEAVIKNYK